MAKKHSSVGSFLFVAASENPIDNLPEMFASVQDFVDAVEQAVENGIKLKLTGTKKDGSAWSKEVFAEDVTVERTFVEEKNDDDEVIGRTAGPRVAYVFAGSKSFEVGALYAESQLAKAVEDAGEELDAAIEAQKEANERVEAARTSKARLMTAAKSAGKSDQF